MQRGPRLRGDDNSDEGAVIGEASPGVFSERSEPIRRRSRQLATEVSLLVSEVSLLVSAAKPLS